MQGPYTAALQQQLVAAQQMEMLFADPKSVASQTVATYTDLIDGVHVHAHMQRSTCVAQTF